MGKQILKQRPHLSTNSTVAESEPIREQGQEPTQKESFEQSLETNTVEREERVFEPQRLESDDINKVLCRLESLVGNDVVLSDLCRAMKDYLGLKNHVVSDSQTYTDEDTGYSDDSEDTLSVKKDNASSSDTPVSPSISVPYEKEIREIASNDKFEAIRKINQLKRDGNINEEDFQYLKNIIKNR